MAQNTPPFIDYPRLMSAPVLSRGPTELQIGYDGGARVVLGGVHPQLAAALALLDGCHTLASIRECSRGLGVPVAQLDWVLRTISNAGLLVGGGPRELPSLASGPRVRLLGAGRLARSVAGLLLGAGVSVLHVIDNDPVDPALYPAAGAVSTQAEALAATLSSSRSAVGEPRGVDTTRILVANHWSKPEGVAPALTIVASDRLECDRVAPDGLTRDDQPQLYLRARPAGVVVGPLVAPGSSACLRCTDLTRRDADPAWPTLLAQLVRTRMPLARVAVDWAAGVAAVQALAFLNGSPPETYGATLEISATDYLTRWRSWSMHAECGCGWAS